MRTREISSLQLCLPAALVLGLALPAAFASLPPFRFGYWDRAEPLVVWLHVCGALGALTLAWVAMRDFRRGWAVLTHAYVLAPAALALWTVLASAFVSSPMLSLLGVPQSGLGALWFLDLAVLVGCGLIVAEERRLWNALCWEACAVTALIGGIKLIDQNVSDFSQSLLLYVAAYYGWVGVSLPVLSRPWLWTWRDWPLASATMAAALLNIYAARSLTAWVIFAIGMALVVAARVFKAGFIPRLTQGVAATTGIVALVTLAPPFVLRALDQVVVSASLKDRVHLQEMMQAAFAHSPAWLMGQGWGRVQDAFHAHLNATGERLWEPTWIFLTSDYFSSHNWLMDTLHAVGLPGVLIMLAGFLVLPVFAAPAARPTATAFAIAYGAIAAVWFHLGISLPFFALAMASVAGRASLVPPKPVWSAAISCALVVIALAQMGTAFALTGFGLSISQSRLAVERQRPDPPAWPQSPSGSDLEVAHAIRDSFYNMAEAGQSQPDAVPVAKMMFATLTTRMPETQSIQMLTTGLGVLSWVYFSRNLSWLEPELPGAQALWRPWLERLLSLAPGRSDIAIPFLTVRAMEGDFATVETMSSAILRRDPGDAVGLYFHGLVLVMNQDPARKRQGISALRASTQAGIERFMPLDPMVRQIISQP